MNILIKQLSSKDQQYFPYFLDLFDRTQGRLLFLPNYFDERTKDKNSFVIGAFVDDKPVGISVAQVINDFSYYLPFDPDINKKLSGKIVGSFASASVDPKLQGHGIGKMMASKRLEWLKSMNCDIILGVSWVSGNTHTSDRVFEKSGFKIIARCDDFYVQQSYERKFICARCGAPPCTCGAIFYQLKLT